MKSKKAQEEIVGFSLVVLLVVIIGLVFLSFSLRNQKPEERQDSEVENLLETMLAYTSDCAVYFPNYLSYLDLIRSCYNNEPCLSGKSACQTLQEASSGLMTASQGDLSSGENKVKAYELNISYASEHSGFLARKELADLLYLRNGNCSGTFLASQQFLPFEQGNLRISLKFCY